MSLAMQIHYNNKEKPNLWMESNLFHWSIVLEWINREGYAVWIQLRHDIDPRLSSCASVSIKKASGNCRNETGMSKWYVYLLRVSISIVFGLLNRKEILYNVNLFRKLR